MTVCLQRLRSALSILTVALATALLPFGCTSTGVVNADYNAQEDRTAYETDAIGISGISWSSGYGSSNSLEVWAEADCSGQNCRPDRVRLIFQMSGSGSVRMENRKVELVADGETFGSARGTDDVRDAAEEAQAMGVIATMEMPFSDFRKIAQAEQVDGSVGTNGFTLTYNSRGPFQAFVQQVTESGGSGESG